MKKGPLFFFFALAAILGDGVANGNPSPAGALTPDVFTAPPGHLSPVPKFGDLPLYFIPAPGPADGPALFSARTPGYTLWLTREGLVFDAGRIAGAKGPAGSSVRSRSGRSLGPGNRPAVYERDVCRLLFLGADQGPRIAASGTTDHRMNSFAGNDPARWRVDVPASSAVLYEGLYRNIDLRVYGIEKAVEYDWLVKPGGDPSAIGFAYDGAAATRIDERGDLVVSTRFGDLIHRKPAAYQVRDGRRVTVDAGFRTLGKDAYGFRVGAYRRDIDLVIDPLVLVYSTYLGGTCSDAVNGLAVDAAGCAYVTGMTTYGDFPVKGAYDKTYNGFGDAFVAKLSPSGRSLVFSTYLGGQAGDDGDSIAVDSAGNIYVLGETFSPDFPLKRAVQASLDSFGSLFITKLSASGNALVYSTFLGGNSTDLAARIAADGTGAAYISGNTRSSDFPMRRARDKTLGGDSDAFLAKLPPAGGELVFSTYLGGSDAEYLFDIVLDKRGFIYLTGGTSSPDFPRKNAFRSRLRGRMDAFLTKLSPDGRAIIYSTLFGGNDFDGGRGIAVDRNGTVFLTGYTKSPDFPLRNAVDRDLNGGCDAFLAAFAPSGRELVFSTYFGGNRSDSGENVALSPNGDAVISGSTFSTDLPTPEAYDGSANGKQDAFLAGFSPAGDRLLYATYFGGNQYEYLQSRGMALGSDGAVYIAGWVKSRNLPVKSAFDKTLSGPDDGYLAKFRPPASKTDRK